MMLTLSLKSRLGLGMIAAFIGLLLAFGLVIYHTISHTLYRQLDASLRSSAGLLAASIESDKEKIGMELDVALMPDFAGKKPTAFYELWRSDGNVAARSVSLGSEDIESPQNLDLNPRFFSSTTKAGRPIRAVAMRFVPNSENKAGADVNKPITLVVARDTHSMLEQLEALRYLLLFASLGIIAVAAIIAVAVVRHGLKPLDSLAAEIRGIDDKNLQTRIDPKDLPAEIAPIQHQLNSLLSRLDASFKRQRTFSADVAHELRTPLAGIRSTIDVALSRDRDSARYREALADCLRVAIAMQTMVDNLLTLARVENGQLTFANTTVNVAAIIAGSWRPLAEKASGVGLAFSVAVPGDLTVESDPSALAMIFSNLFDNAVEYTPQGGRIKVTACKTNGGTQISVSNDAGSFNPEKITEVFERFWRGDDSRCGSGIHCGLGLVLVRRIAQALYANTSAEMLEGMFTIRLTFGTRRLE